MVTSSIVERATPAAGCTWDDFVRLPQDDAPTKSASIGVPECWIVDPNERSIDRLVSKQGAYDVLETCEGDAVFRPERLRGLTIPLVELWRALLHGKHPPRTGRRR